ncbi:uncharacterized protein LOC131877163 isoform X2 [Tigriopus californicus]|uniref:uncharacterized protein LOC131877163 isoform X2 n=1 Tax=Tigriopus californicus TaxID=6832 RepID=UPI0027D9FDB2|nr:uncharacterized protein LOC131877163 isoform X2 [Tigriopus californicus]
METNHPQSKQNHQGEDVVLNLFTMEREDSSSLLPTTDSCPEAFDRFFNLTFPRRDLDHLSPQRVLKRLLDESHKLPKDNLPFTFLPGQPGSEGYPACYEAPKSDMEGEHSGEAQGPCVKSFMGEECKYYPEFPISMKVYPACCDETGCQCECIYQCTQTDQIRVLLSTHLLEKDFLECSTQLSGRGEAQEWKENRCEETKREHYSQMEHECARNGSGPVCIKQGTCIRDICKFCLRWECGEIWTNLSSLGLTQTHNSSTTAPQNSEQKEQQHNRKQVPALEDEMMMSFTGSRDRDHNLRQPFSGSAINDLKVLPNGVENGRSASRNKANHNHHHPKRHRHRHHPHHPHHEPRPNSRADHFGPSEMYDFQSSNPELSHPMDQHRHSSHHSQTPNHRQYLSQEKLKYESDESNNNLRRKTTYSSMSQEAIEEDVKDETPTNASPEQTLKPDIHTAVASMIKAWKILEALDEI